MNDPVITIIGGGLSALYSYWGALDAGYTAQEIEVLYTSRNAPVGAVFMYESPIPWQYTNVTSILFGTCDGYSINQWGHVRKTSAHTRFRNGDFPVITDQLYMLEEMLVTLWGMILRKREIDFITEEQINSIKPTRKAIICTFPNKDLKQKYKERKLLDYIPIYSNSIVSDKHIVIYNGDILIPWVRQTIVPGSIFTEYPFMTSSENIIAYETMRGNKGGKLSLIQDLMPDSPPLSWEERIEDNLLRVGRLSCFTSGYLSNQARREVTKFLRAI
jgi:hypothetical protein